MAAKVTNTNSEFVVNEINNVSSDIIRITEDKLRLKVGEYEKSLAHSYDWIGPAGIVITIVLAMLTSDFKYRFGVTAKAWNIIFSTCFVFAFCYTIWVIIKAFKRMSIDDFIDGLKK